MMTSLQIAEEQLESILKGFAIPPQPQVLVDLTMETSNPDFSVSSVAAIILQDIGLSGSIIKTINSPAFKTRTEIQSIPHAIGMLGIPTVMNIVNAVSIKNALSDDAIISLTRFWDSATDIAAAASVISEHTGLGRPTEAYLLGLFHNCGNILMYQRYEDFPETLERSYSQPHVGITELENARYATNHAIMGYYIARSWKLPPHITSAIYHHHGCEQIFLQDDPVEAAEKCLLASLKLAEHICGNHRILSNQSTDYEWQTIGQEILEYANLSEFEFKSLREHIEDLGFVNP